MKEGRRDGKDEISALFFIPGSRRISIIFHHPNIIGFYYSFTDWNINAEQIRFNGLDNYIELFKEPRLKTALINTLIFAAVVTLMQNFWD